MQYSPSIPELQARAKAINVTLPRLAKEAGLAASTAYRAFKGKGETRKKTDRKLLAGIEKIERELLKHLFALHGAPKPDSETSEERDAA